MQSDGLYHNPFATMLSGGVGGARMARGLANVLPPGDLTAIVNVGDDERVYGLHVSADVDTVIYTLAGIEGQHGWGIAGDAFTVVAQLETLDVDTTFRLGDRDLANCLYRTTALTAGTPLSSITATLAKHLGVSSAVLPATDAPLRTRLLIEGRWVPFQEYFVYRGHRDPVTAIEFAGSADAQPAPGVLEAIATAELVVVAPSNPPLSIWPILAVDGVRAALAARDRVVAISPLFGGKPVKGPADRVMAGLGLAAGNAGVLEAYAGVVTDLVVDAGDAADVDLASADVAIHTADTRIARSDQGTRFAQWLVERFT